MDQAEASNLAARQGRRWRLQDVVHFAETPRAHVFRATAPEGPVALKLYKHIGWSGEGAAIPFLRDLKPGVGVRIFRKHTLRAAILMDWLEGPSLAEVAKDGRKDFAYEKLAEVAHGIATSHFRFPVMFRRLAPAMRANLAKRIGQSDADATTEMHRAQKLLTHLTKTTKREHIIHGDLALTNVILTNDGPRLIDPKALRADPPLEFTKDLAAPRPDASPADLLDDMQHRAETLCKPIQASPERAIQWAITEFAKRLPIAAPKNEAEARQVAQVRYLLDNVGH